MPSPPKECTNMIANIIIGLVIVCLFVLAVRHVLKKHSNGGCDCGCGCGCDCCSAKKQTDPKAGK